MVKRHIKRFATPTTWQIKRKGITFVTRPNPGTHPQHMSLPISIVLKEMIKAAKTTKEVKKILYSNEVLVDGRRVKDHCFPVGLMDVITIKLTNQSFRIVFDEKGNLITISADQKEAKNKICRITGKTLLKRGKTQINLSDSRNIITEKDSYKVGDSLMIELPSQKIVEYFKLEKGAAILLISGKHIADIGVVEELKGNNLVYKNKKGENLLTLKKYAFAVGKEKPALKIR